ncbi:uncharacterized protein EV420DRAFT_1521305 [Desarmillaria tabescens]|uniref:Uncharacterized protein n=1 Tax=Armillaria tabescens TaxID=1929756 RepID=A0AA39TY54_ARMTA|nr:uncharacterized protein EV420DRAFT_1521305 [Desarmillaria tabescens]KAK0462855.1 hypothetical protein EV420DRAFT_1521305 [Desarmillaria tabescens]
MANLTRNVKSGNEWTQSELSAYNILVEEKSLAEFFGVDELPPLADGMSIFSETEDRCSAPDDETYKLLLYLDLANRPRPGQEASVQVFTKEFLQKLGYDAGRRIVMIQQKLPFIVCGTKCSAQTDVCILEEDEILLLVQENKRLDIPDDPEPQLVAEAIASFQHNNIVRERDLHLPALDEAIFPAIALYGTFPIFYKIKVTSTLVVAVGTGTYPVDTTIVHRHVPKLPLRHSDPGMKPLDNRKALIRYFQVFKQFI